jgi:hypothetical protein
VTAWRSTAFVQARVLDRHDRLAREVLEQLLLLAGERLAVPGDRDRPEVLGAVHQRAQPDRQRVHAVAPHRHRPARALRPLVSLEGADQLRAHVRADHEHVALRRLDRPLELTLDRADVDAGERATGERKGAPHLGLARIHRLAHRQSDHAAPVEPGRECVADPANRLGELLPLAFDLLDLRLELPGHVVELTAERGELVAPVDRHAAAEVSAREPARGIEEGGDLAR